MNPNLKNFSLLLLLGFCWGPSFLFIKIAVEYIPPITITTCRLLIGAVLLFGILKFRGVSLPKPQASLKHLFIAALFQSAVPFTLFGLGEQYIDSGMAAMISGASPLFTLFIAHFFAENDKITKVKAIGAVIGFFGLFVLVLPSLMLNHSDPKFGAFGALMILAGAMCYSIAFVYTKKHIRGFKPLVAPTIQLFLGFIFLLPFCLTIDKPFTIEHIPTSAILSVIALGVLGTATAFVLYYKILEATNSTYLSMVNYITPAIGAILGVVVLSEKLSWNSYLGCAMILLGVMTANGLIKIKKR